ncbi:MAG: hypothetical protein KGI71_06045 [Patescibacteria group bacterium]|nr:hypothetical protein [Patescibacteria group bacterium]
MTNTADQLKETLSRINRLNTKPVGKKTAKKAKNDPFMSLIQQPKKKRRPERMKFALWLSIPRQFIGQAPAKLEQLGVVNEEVIQLAQIPTAKEFSKRYKISEQSLTAWRAELERDPDVIMHFRKSAQILTKNVLMAFYAEMLKNPTPEGVKTWLWTMHGETQKTEVTSANLHLHASIADYLDALEAKGETPRVLTAHEKDHGEDDED